MNIENVRKWITALRSGEYKQTRRRLQDKYGYCCLGVATDLYIRETRKARWGASVKCKFHAYEYPDSVDPNAGFLPAQVSDWLGITMDRQMDLALMNDAGSTFLDIASVLENYCLAAEKEAKQ